MIERAPLIDPRTAAQVAADVKKLVTVHLPQWKPDQDRLGTALIAIFARFAELVIERLNRAPDKNFLAFLDLLGAARLPPEPARAPLTFALAEDATVDAVVPAGTQVGGTPPAGDQQALLFETERDLVVTSARLQSLFVREPLTDRYADRSAILSAERASEAPAFVGERAIEHCFYLGHQTLLACTAIQELKLDVKLEKTGHPLSLRWEIWDGKEGIKLSPEDGTAGLSKNGSVVFKNPGTFPERMVYALTSERRIGTLTSRWLRCRLETAIELKWDEGEKTFVPLPTIKDLTLSVVSAGDAPDAASANTLPLDLGKEVFPFGEKPKLGDSFYLSHREAFSQEGAKITLRLSVVDPKAYIQERPIPARGTPTLVWELWNGRAWAAFTPTKDDSVSFTATGPRTVEFTVPAIQPALINGIDNYWIRVRISSGDYGKDAGINLKTDANGQPKKDTDGQFIFTLQPSTLVPPQLAGLSVGYTQEAKPEAIVTVNDFVYQQEVPGAFQPFLVPTETGPALYLGFGLPAGRAAFPNRPLSLYFSIAETEHQYAPDSATPSSAPALAFEYWNGTWAGTSVQDGTETLVHSGIVGWLAPADIAPKADFGLPECYWLRLRLAGGVYPHPPRLHRLLLNATIAAQTMTLMNEVLGSSDGNEGQRFRTNHAPVLPGQQLEILEAEIPTAIEQAEIRTSEGQEAIRASETTTPHTAVWVRWHEVPDFYGAGPRDRHYVLDHIQGEVRFGDGHNGLIPPRGIGNIRVARYQTGGGAGCNVPAGAITQLKTTLPYVDRVSNPAPALGGADAETVEALRTRTPRQLRHGGRAVTRDDYEDLALLASPEVARARCVPLWDPSSPKRFDSGNEKHRKPGNVTLIVVPRSTDAAPKPSIELVRRVTAYLDDRRLPGVKLHVIGPQYLEIGVTAVITPASLEAATFLRSAVEDALARFLHPLTGGATGTGWAWGRAPSPAAFYKTIHAIPGVGQVRTLTVPDIEDLEKTEYFLVCAGQHKISLHEPT